MLRLDKVIKPWKESMALNAHINLYGFWNETAFLTKSGDLGMVLSVPGVDYESLDRSEQEYAVKRLEAALKAFGPGFHVYQYLFKSNRPDIPFARYHDPIVEAAIDQRRKFFEAIRTDGMKQMIRIPKRAEAQHIQIIGDTGAGKTAIMLQILRQIKTRGDSAIVYDPAREFVQRFYDPKNGDVILNPLDKRCPYWGPAEELRRRSEAKALAVSLFQPPHDKKGEFFIESPQKIFAFLMAYGPTPEELVKWMSDPQEIDRRLKGTEHAHLIDPKAEHQRAGVLGSLGLVADSLRLLPKKGDGNGEWSATEWAETRQGWIFITSLPAEREALRPKSMDRLARLASPERAQGRSEASMVRDR
jgi:hypothetical protein